MEIGELSGRQDILYGPNAMIEQTLFVPETSIEDICKNIYIFRPLPLYIAIRM